MGGSILWSTLGLVAVLGIGGCMWKFPPPTAEEIRQSEERHIESALPDGCKVTLLGSIGEIDEVVAVQCDAQSATATTAQTSRQRQVGRTFYQEHDASVVLRFAPQEAK